MSRPTGKNESRGVGPQGAAAVGRRRAEFPPPDDEEKPRLSLLIELLDRPGALQDALQVFAVNGINLTQIESRPTKHQAFDFYVDCEGERDDPAIEATIEALRHLAMKLLVLDDRTVPWFPRQINDMDKVANHTLEAGVHLQGDHPGFNDADYRVRRNHIDQQARQYRQGATIPRVDYSKIEQQTWGTVYRRLRPLHEQYACHQYRRIFAELEQHCGFNAEEIPQARTVNAYLESSTGFKLRPVAGLLSSRDFLNALAFRVFFATQYIRHHSRPLYTPEPDVCHELIGHAPMFADTAFADLSQEIGLASLGASDDEIERLARCYWHSVEFGLVNESGAIKAYGAGLLSSFGELEYACNPPEHQDSAIPEFRPWDPAAAARQDFPITEYQPIYFVAESLHAATGKMREYCESLPRPFYARLNSANQSIWVDRAVRRQSAEHGDDSL